MSGAGQCCQPCIWLETICQQNASTSHLISWRRRAAHSDLHQSCSRCYAKVLPQQGAFLPGLRQGCFCALLIQRVPQPTTASRCRSRRMQWS